MRYTEHWFAAVMASGLKARAKAYAYSAQRHADWDTGQNCYISAKTAGQVAGISERTAERARAELEAAGFLTRSGLTHTRNTTDYRLTIPLDVQISSANPGGTEQFSSANSGGTDDQFSSANPGGTDGSVPPTVAVSSANRGGQPPQTSEGGRDEEEGYERVAATPHAAPVTQIESQFADDIQSRCEALAASIALTLGRRWRDDWPDFRMNRKHLDGIKWLIGHGWSDAAVLAAVCQIGKPRLAPASMLLEHLYRLQSEDPADHEPLIAVETAMWQADDINRARKAEEELARNLTCAHGVRLAMLERDLSNCYQCHEAAQADRG